MMNRNDKENNTITTETEEMRAANENGTDGTDIPSHGMPAQDEESAHSAALLRFFEEADRMHTAAASDSGDGSADADGEAFFSGDAPLFAPELSEPLAIIDEKLADEEPAMPDGTDDGVFPDTRTAPPIKDHPAEDSTAAADAPVIADNPDSSDSPAEEDGTEPVSAGEDAAEVPCTEQTEQTEAHGAKRILRGIGIAVGCTAAAAAIVFCVLTGILYYCSRQQTVDLDETVSLGALADNPLLAALTTAERDPDSVDTSSIGDESIPLVFFGFLKRNMQIAVRDLTPPVLDVYAVTVPYGMTPEAQLCVRSCSDKTAVAFSFESVPDTHVPGERTVTLLAQDEGGNITAADVRFEVLSEADSAPLAAEFGISVTEIEAALGLAYPELTEPDLSALDITACGTYYVTGKTDADETDKRVVCVRLADTTPPTGRAHSFTFAAGAADDSADDHVLTPEDFVTEIIDASPVTLSYKTAPDYRTFTTQEIIVTARDAAGNETDFTCSLQLLDIPDSMTVECGTTLSAFIEELMAEVPEEERPTPDPSFDPADIAPGEYTLRLSGRYSTLSVLVRAVDTVPPVLTMQPVTAYIDHLPDASSLAQSVTDATAVSVYYETEPDVSREGVVTASVIAEDAAGNRTRGETTLTVIADTQPPVIYGVQNLYVAENSTVSYRKNVSAYDNADGAVAVRVNADAVDITKSGTYIITYTATDSAGNTSSQSARVYVTGANQVTLDMYADQILSGIVTQDMTARQKAYAIYGWCVSHIRYSTSTSHLMGSYMQAAYSGFTTHAGNCYIYYAVASTLLSRAGIENMEIHRDNTKAPHYWNLVKIDGSWYHLDTCPKKAKYPLKAFLLTDREVADYSENQAVGYYSFDHSLYPATP
ncbi:MAG: transglutaminase domain-containing protein [Eubacteriales bacterium]